MFGQALGTGTGNRGNFQPRKKLTQLDAGGEVRGHSGLILQLHTALQQLTDHRAVMLIFEEGGDLMGNLSPDLRQKPQHLGPRLADALEATQRPGQQFGGFLTDIGDAQRIDEAGQAHLLALLDCQQQVVGGYLGKTFQGNDLLIGEREQVRGRADQVPLDQLLDDLLPQAVDIKRPTGDEMDDRLLQLGLAGQPTHAAIDRALGHGLRSAAALDQLGALDCRSAYRAVFRHMYRPGIGRAHVDHHLHHLGDDVASAADDHRITDHHPQPLDLVHIVQGCIGYGHTGYLHRAQASHGRYRPGAAHLELHIQQLGHLFTGGKLVGDRPARLAGAKTQLPLPAQVVDLEHYPIDFVGQAIAPLTDIPVILQAAFDALDQLEFAADQQTPVPQSVQDAYLGIGQLALEAADAVAAELQRTLGGNVRIELAQ